VLSTAEPSSGPPNNLLVADAHVALFEMGGRPFMTLIPGDLIATRTPTGAARSHDLMTYLHIGLHTGDKFLCSRVKGG
jgi:hypothetical protein